MRPGGVREVKEVEPYPTYMGKDPLGSWRARTRVYAGEERGDHILHLHHPRGFMPYPDTPPYTLAI
jgi:hypothetical protein